jgi:hypothetical protein
MYFDVTKDGATIVNRFAYRKRNHKHYVKMIHKNATCLSFVITFGKPKHYAFYTNDEKNKRLTRDKYFRRFGHPICD